MRKTVITALFSLAVAAALTTAAWAQELVVGGQAVGTACAALLTGCRSNVSNTTDGRVDGTEPSALIPTAASEIVTEPSATTDDSRTESESGMTEASEGTTNAANARSRR